MYSVKNLFTKNPVTISAAVVALVNLAIILDVIWFRSIDAEGVAALDSALVLVLGLFVNATTANVAVLNEFDEAMKAAKPKRKAPAKKAAKAVKKGGR